MYRRLAKSGLGYDTHFEKNAQNVSQPTFLSTLRYKQKEIKSLFLEKHPIFFRFVMLKPA
jgi:hypothetical protein